jgi:hypothetical protein
LVPESFLRALIGPIDLRVVRELARLSEACVEGLVRLLRAVVTVGLEEIATAICQDDGTVGGTERSGSNQPFMSKVPQTAVNVRGAVAQVVLGQDPKRANGCQRVALGTVDLVRALALADQFAVRAAR